MMRKNIVYVILVMMAFVSCKQKAEEPSFLKIESFTVTTDNITQGSAQQNISEAFVYINDQIVGVYHLPASIPLAISGSYSIKVFPAVVENAIASNPRYSYTFLKAFDTTAVLTASKSITIKPTTTYQSTVKFVMIEDFENILPLFGKTTYNNIDTLLRDSLPADNIEPGHCALFDIKDGYTMEYATRNEYSLPTSSSSETFVEINYRSDLPLAIGLFINEPTTIIKTGVVTLNAKETWSKAYINITNVVSVHPLGTKFRLFIGALNTTGASKKVFVDNIKLIHFE